MIATLLSFGISTSIQIARPYYILSDGKTEIRAYLQMKLDPQSKSHKLFRVKLLFKKIKSGKNKVIGTFDCGYSFGMPEQLISGYFAENGRDQLYIVTRYGSTESYVLDCDGQHVIALYKHTGDRTATNLIFDEKEGYYVKESSRYEPIGKRYFLRQGKSKK